MAKSKDEQGFYPRPQDGSLPDPDDLKKFEKILPGTADRIISMAEREQAERIKQGRWERWARFFSGVANFILKVFDVIAKFILKVFAAITKFLLEIFYSISSSFETLSKESARILRRTLVFLLGIAALAAPVYIALEVKSDINSFAEIAIALATALGAMLAGRSVYLRIGKFRLGSGKKAAESVSSVSSIEPDKSIEASSKE